MICRFTSNNFNYSLLVAPSFANGRNLFVLPLFKKIIFNLLLLRFYFRHINRSSYLTVHEMQSKAQMFTRLKVYTTTYVRLRINQNRQFG